MESIMKGFDLPEETFEEFAESLEEGGMEAVKAQDKDASQTLADLVEAVNQLNLVINGSDAKAITEATLAVDTARKTHNEQLILTALRGFLKAEKPILAALKQGFIDQVKIKIVLHKSKQGKMEIVTREATIEDGNPMTVPLEALEKEYTEVGMLCVNGQWPYMTEKFCKLMNAKATADVGGDTAKFAQFYKIQPKAQDCDMGAMPTSNTQVTKQLQRIVDAILFEGNDKEQNIYKVEGRDVKFIEYVMIREGKTAGIVCCRPQTMIKLITKALHRIVNNGTYDVEYKTIDVDKKAVPQA